MVQQETEELTGLEPEKEKKHKRRRGGRQARRGKAEQKREEKSPSTMEALFRRDRSWILFLGSALVAGIAFVSLLLVQRNILRDYEKAYVITTRVPVHIGADLTEANAGDYFTVAEIPASMVPEGAYRFYAEEGEPEYAYIARMVNGQVTTTDLAKGEILVSANLEEGPYPESVAAEGLVEVSFSLPSIVQAVAGTLRRGDEVSIAVFDNEQFEDGVVLDHIILKQAYASDGILLKTGEEGQALLFTVLLTREQEATLNRMIAGGGMMRLSRTNHIRY